jgi:hypothetical protein
VEKWKKWRREEVVTSRQLGSLIAMTWYLSNKAETSRSSKAPLPETVLNWDRVKKKTSVQRRKDVSKQWRSHVKLLGSPSWFSLCFF